MQIFFRSSKRKCGIKGSSSDELFDVKLTMVQDTKSVISSHHCPWIRSNPLRISQRSSTGLPKRTFLPLRTEFPKKMEFLGIPNDSKTCKLGKT